MKNLMIDVYVIFCRPCDERSAVYGGVTFVFEIQSFQSYFWIQLDQTYYFHIYIEFILIRYFDT